MEDGMILTSRAREKRHGFDRMREIAFADVAFHPGCVVDSV